jgi:archaellum component FlaC
MAEDDIIQRIVIQGAEDAAAAFNSIGDAATRTMQQTGAAVDASTEKLGSIQAAATRAGVSYDQMASRVAAASAATNGLNTAAGTIAASVGQTSTALNGAATAAAAAGTAFNFTRGEMRLMHEIAGELGFGPLASLATILGKTTLELGLMAAGAVGAALAIGVLVKFADDATKSVAALGRLADISGRSFEDLSAEQIAFQKLGVGAEQFTKEFTNLELEINKAAPQIADQMARSADQTAAAFLKIQTAALSTRQVFQQGVQLNLQTQQLGLQAQQLQLQLQYQQQNFAIQQKRADLSVKDAEANVRILSLKQQLRSGDIDEEEFAERMAQEENAANKRALEKAKVDRDAAVLAKQQLSAQQDLQAAQLKLQIEQNAQQQQANALAKERNQIDQQQAVLAEKTAKQDALKTQANDLEKVVGLMKQLAAGEQATFDPLTTMDTKVKAVEASLEAARKNGENVKTVLANILQAIPSTADAFNIGRALGLDDKSIAEMRAKGGAFIQEMADKEKAANAAMTDADRERFTKYEEELNKISANWDNFKKQIGGGFVAGVTWLDDWEKSFQKLGTTIGEIIPAAFNTMKDTASSVLSAIGGWIGSLVDKAVALWRAIKGAGDSTSSGESGSIPMPMAEGGLFNGQRSGIDTNLVWLTSGEFVMSTNAVRAYGVGMMNAINSLRAPRFAVGGLNVPVPRLAGVTPTPSLSGQRTLNLTIEGRSFSGLSLPENTAQSLERFAVHSQIASTGRKQSWRR